MITEMNWEKRSASCWSFLRKYITMHGPQSVTLSYVSYSCAVVTVVQAEPSGLSHRNLWKVRSADR